MSNRLNITTERVEWPFDASYRLRNSVFWQFRVCDDYDQWTVDIKDKRQAAALHKKGPTTIIKHCIEDGADVCALLESHKNNGQGCSVDGVYVEVEELAKILNDAEEESDAK